MVDELEVFILEDVLVCFRFFEWSEDDLIDPEERAKVIQKVFLLDVSS